MMMDSPIDLSVNRAVFHCAAAVVTTGVAISLLRERWATQAILDAPFTAVKKAKHADERLDAWKGVLQTIMEEQRARKDGSKIALVRHVAAVISALKTTAPIDNDVIDCVLLLIRKGYASNPAGLVAFTKSGGSRAVLSLLATAHKDGNKRIMESAAAALCALTEVDDSEIILPSDVPLSALPAYELCRYPMTVKMLRTLEPNAPIVFLSAVTGIFCNVAALHKGAVAIHKGIEGKSGLWYFLRLLTHHNQGVVESSAKTVSSIVNAGLGHEEIADSDNLSLVADLINVNMDPKTVSAALTIIVVMLGSPQSDLFFSNLEHKTTALANVFSVWCRASTKNVRDRAEMLVRLLERLTSCGPAIRRLLEVNRDSIMERKMMDEDANKKQQQAQRKQEMMQKMMMQQMMGGGGGGGAEEMMMGMGGDME